MNIEIVECRVCDVPIFLTGDNSKLADHEEWHEAQAITFKMIKRRLEILEGLVRDPK